MYAPDMPNGVIAFDRVTVFGHTTHQFWMMPNGEAASTLASAVNRTARHLMNARSVVGMFKTIKGDNS